MSERTSVGPGQSRPLTRHAALSPHRGRGHPHGGLLCGRTPHGHAAQGLLAALYLGIQGMQVRVPTAPFYKNGVPLAECSGRRGTA